MKLLVIKTRNFILHKALRMGTFICGRLPTNNSGKRILNFHKTQEHTYEYESFADDEVGTIIQDVLPIKFVDNFFSPFIILASKNFLSTGMGHIVPSNTPTSEIQDLKRKTIIQRSENLKLFLKKVKKENGSLNQNLSYKKVIKRIRKKFYSNSELSKVFPAWCELGVIFAGNDIPEATKITLIKRAKMYCKLHDLEFNGFEERGFDENSLDYVNMVNLCS